MRLTELTISGLRCYISSITLPMHSLTVLIGENDSGKSTVVRALQLLLSQLNPSVDDYAQEADGHAASGFELTGRFVLDDTWDAGGFDFEENGTRFLVIRKSYSVTGRPQCCIYGEVYEDDRFNTYQDPQHLTLGETDVLAVGNGIPRSRRQSQKTSPPHRAA